MSLTKYLVSQLMLSNDERMDDLRVFFPNAKNEDWEVITAGQRVQVIKDTEDSKGNLQFGTEVITSDDGKLPALLGVLPGASQTAVDIMFMFIQVMIVMNLKDGNVILKSNVLSFGYWLKYHEDLYHKSMKNK